MRDLFTPIQQDTAESSTSGRKVLSVSQLNRKAKQLLEVHLPLVWVEAEISNFSRPSSGHWYFTLKDANAQIRCAMFKGRNTRVNFKIEEGTKVQARAKVSLYEGRGDYQLIVEHIEEAGFGLLQKRFEQLKFQLHSEGLFDESLKKPLPAVPSHIGIITSQSAAALRDVLSVLSRRFPLCEVTLIPTPVQGEGADKHIVRALQLADDSGRFDTLLLCRGGGSIEDLWCFNSEELARTIVKLKTPIVSGVGHEVDFTIVDFVADVRAPTPSAAAELLAPSVHDLSSKLNTIQLQLRSTIARKQHKDRSKLELLSEKLKHPGDRIQQWQQRLDTIELKLNNLVSKSIHKQTRVLDELKLRLSQHTPSRRLALHKQTLEHFRKLLVNAQISLIEKSRANLLHSTQTLHIVSPLATLGRGYAIVKNKEGTVIRSADEVNTGDLLRVTLANGDIETQVTNSKN